MNVISSATILLAASMGTNPVDFAVEDLVDLIEVNHFYDEHGKHVFDQLIFYDWSPQESRFEVRAWRMMKKVRQEPLRDWNTSDYKLIFHEHGILRKVRGASFHETWTQFDPEIADRQLLPMHLRRELTRMIPQCKKHRQTDFISTQP